MWGVRVEDVYWFKGQKRGERSSVVGAVSRGRNWTSWEVLVVMAKQVWKLQGGCMMHRVATETQCFKCCWFF